MRRAIALCMAIACSIPLLTGCWDRRELDQLGIQMGTSIDKIEGEYRVAVQVVLPGEVSVRTSSSGISPVTLYEATAPTIFEAFRKLTETSPRKIYSAHIRIVVLGESLAREGIADVLDMFSRNPETRSDFYLMVARKSSGLDVLKMLTSLEKIPAENLFSTLDASAKTWAPTTTVSIEKLIEELVTEGLNPVLTGVEVAGARKKGGKLENIQVIDPGAQSKFRGLAVFRKDKLKGWLNEDQSKGFNYLMNNVQSSAGHLACPEGGYVVLETSLNNTKVKADIVNGEPIINVKMKNVSSVADVECKIDLKKPETIRLLEKESEKKLIALMNDVVVHVQKKYGFDIFGFGQALYQSHPRAWNKMKGNWSETFKGLKVKYDVEVQIHKIGTTNDSFQNYIEE